MSVIKERTLINDEYLKAYSPIPLNYNMDEIHNYVKVAELIYIKPILGINLYEELLDEVEENNVTEINSTLLLNIYPLLSFSVIYEALPFIWSHISEVGITLGKSDNSNSVALKDIDYILNHLKAQIDVRIENLKEFLDSHYESYPLYEKTTCCIKKDSVAFKQLYSTKKLNNEIK